jgi:hypothetical protein
MDGLPIRPTRNCPGSFCADAQASTNGSNHVRLRIAESVVFLSCWRYYRVTFQGSAITPEIDFGLGRPARIHLDTKGQIRKNLHHFRHADHQDPPASAPLSKGFVAEAW